LYILPRDANKQDSEDALLQHVMSLSEAGNKYVLKVIRYVWSSLSVFY